MGTSYDADIVAWANEQAALLRNGQLSAIDALQIAEEIEDVAKCEKRELKSRLVVLLAHLLKWSFCSGTRFRSWRLTIDAQRQDIALILNDAPSLMHTLSDRVWLESVWRNALASASAETERDLPAPRFPIDCPWTIGQILNQTFLPGSDPTP